MRGCVPRNEARETVLAAGGAEGDGIGPESFALGRSCGSRVRGVPRNEARVTDFAAGGAEGDGFGPESVTLGRSCGSRVRGVPRNEARVTDFAAGGAEGDGFGPESVALVRSRGSWGWGAPRTGPREKGVGALPSDSFPLGMFCDTRRGGMPPQVPRVTVFAAGGAEGDGFGPESVSLGRSRGARRALS